MIQPLNVGNYWVFRVTSGDGRFEKTMTQSVVDSLDFEYEGRNIRAWQIKWANKDPNDEDIGAPLLSNADGGLYNNGDIQFGDTVLTNRIKLLYPATVGSEFNPGGIRITSSGVVREFNDLRTTVVSTDSIISTRAGLFSAYVYRRTYIPSGGADDDTEVSIDQFYSPGIGPVAEISHDAQFGTRKTLLVDYQICRWE